MLLSTEALVTDVPEKKDDKDDMGHHHGHEDFGDEDW
jgi:hypothetical protein